MPDHDQPDLEEWLLRAAEICREQGGRDSRFAHAPHRGVLIQFRRHAAGHDDVLGLEGEEAWDAVARAWPEFLTALDVLRPDAFEDPDQARACWLGGWDEIRCPVGQEPDQWALRLAQRHPLQLASVWPRCGEREIRLASAAAWLQLREGVQAPMYLPCRTWGPWLGVGKTWVSDTCRRLHALDLLRTAAPSTGKGIAARYRFACHRFPALHQLVTDWGWSIAGQWQELEHAFAAIPPTRRRGPRQALLLEPRRTPSAGGAAIIPLASVRAPRGQR